MGSVESVNPRAENSLDGVSFIMPVRDDAEHLSAAVISVLSQSLDRKWELIIAVAPSQDDSEVVALSLRDLHPNAIRIVANPEGGTSQGLNAAIAASSFETLIRVDAHCVLHRDYAQIAVHLLESLGVANAGGIMQAAGKTQFQKAVAYAYNKRIGLGGGAFHSGGESGPVDTVYLGCFRKSWVETVGGFDSRWTRGQDWELNKRIRLAGGTIWFDPRLVVTYIPRAKWRALVFQFYKTGYWRGALTRDDPASASLRYWIPPLLLVSSVAVVPLVLYLTFVVLCGIFATGLSATSKLWLMVVLPSIHLSWGFGFLQGWAKQPAKN